MSITLAIFAFIVLLGLAGTVHARLTLASVTEESLARRGHGITGYLEGEARGLLQSQDVSGLNQRINTVMHSNADVLYIVVLGEDGSVEASTFASTVSVALPIGFPPDLLEANRVPEGAEEATERVRLGDQTVLDIAQPISGNQGGVVRVGLSLERVGTQVDSLTRTLLLFTGVVLLAGLAACYPLALLLTRPLRQLADAARAVGSGDLSRRVDVSTSDEVGELASAFNTMTSRLREKEQDQSRLMERLISAQEDERKRVARELHDEAGQALTSLLLGLNQLRQGVPEDETRERAAALHGVASETLEQMRRLSYDLRPSALDDLGLVPALERYVEEYGHTYGVKTDFYAGSAVSQRLSPQQQTAVYRIVQEALTNSARHAQGSNVSVTMEMRGTTLVVIAEDDGDGFYWRGSDATLRSRSLGLLGMEERAAIIGAELTIESQPGSGTAVFLEIPL